MTDKIRLSWQVVINDCRKLAQRIRDAWKPFPKGTPQSGVPFSQADIRLYGVPRGGVPVALLVRQFLQEFNYHVTVTDDPHEATHFVDDIYDTGDTCGIYLLEYSENHGFWPLYDAKKDWAGKWVVFPWEVDPIGKRTEGVEANITRILEYIGEDPGREGLVETPRRVSKSYDTLFGGYNQNPDDVFKVFTDDSCDEMVILKDIEFYSTCEHHLLPFFGKAHIGYLPNGRVIGVSKLARLLEIFARRAQIQERIGQQITETLMEKLDPLGAACVLEAQHFCMTSRGVQKQNSVMVTSSMRGAFREDPAVRAEFLRMIEK